MSRTHLRQRVSREIIQSTDQDRSEERDQRAARNFKPKKKSQWLQGKMEKAHSWEDLVSSCKLSSLVLPYIMCVLLSDVKRLSCPPPFSSLLLPLQHCETQSLQVCLSWWRQAGCNPPPPPRPELLVCGLSGRENSRKTVIFVGRYDIGSRSQTESKLLDRC